MPSGAALPAAPGREEHVMADVSSNGTRLALLGYGAVAALHATSLQALGGSIVVVAGPNREEALTFARRHGIGRVETDPEKAIRAPDVEAVVVASPSAVHASQARAILDADRHALVEIPLALSVSEAESLVALAAARHRTLMVCHTTRYNETFLAARELIERGQVRPRNIVARCLFRRHGNVGWTGRRRTWTDDLLWHHGGHCVDAVLAYLGDPVDRVTAAVGPTCEGSGLPMDYAITLHTANGAIASIALSYHALVSAADYLVIGEDETVAIQNTEVRTSTGVVLDGGDFATIERRAFLEQDRDFLESIRSGRAPATAAATILPAMRVLQAVQDRVI